MKMKIGDTVECIEQIFYDASNFLVNGRRYVIHDVRGEYLDLGPNAQEQGWPKSRFKPVSSSSDLRVLL